MSLVSTYVQSQEGQWYQDPIVKGPGWFICWDDDDPIELVIEKAKGITPEEILAACKALGWHLTITSKGNEGQRMFGKKIEFKPASSYFLQQKLTGLGPPASMLEGNKPLKEPPKGQGVYYTSPLKGGKA